MSKPSSRAEAKALGEKWYFTGQPCKHGHIEDRLTSDGKCRECGNEKVRARDRESENARMREARARDPEAAREKDRQYRLENLEERRAYERAWSAANPDKIKAKHRKRYDADPDKQKARCAPYGRVTQARRRSRARESSEHYTLADVESLYDKQHGNCAACHSKLNGVYHVDHVIPLKRGGNNSRRNIQILCPPCNMEKSAKDPIDFMRSKGLLL